MPRRLTTKEFIEKAQIVHNNKYNYSNVNYIKSSEKVTIICPIHGEFQQTPNNHLKGQGCPKCKHMYVANLQRQTTKDFIEKAKRIHNNQYNYNKVIYGKNNKEKVIIICPIHGEFLQTPHDHLYGYGCPECGKYRAKIKNSDTLETFIEKSNKVHNNKYDYSKSIYLNSRTELTITCPKHGEFVQKPNMHIQGEGCPSCQLKSQSNLYNKLKEQFPKENIIFEAGRDIINWIGLQRFDIYFPKYNIAVEYNGEQHYIPIEHFGGKLGLTNTQKRDELKRKKCKENNCNLFEIKYNYTEQDYNNLVFNINNIIKEYGN